MCIEWATKPGGVKALSLLQPWASLVVLGFKTIETRSWRTAYRGPLLIHASLGKSGAALAEEPPFTKYISDFKTLPFGTVIGSVLLDDVVPAASLFYSDAKWNRLTLEEKAFGDYSTGRYAWLLSEPEVFEVPVPARGSLNLWTYRA